MESPLWRVTSVLSPSVELATSTRDGRGTTLVLSAKPVTSASKVTLKNICMSISRKVCVMSYSQRFSQGVQGLKEMRRTMESMILISSLIIKVGLEDLNKLQTLSLAATRSLIWLLLHTALRFRCLLMEMRFGFLLTPNYSQFFFFSFPSFCFLLC